MEASKSSPISNYIASFKQFIAGGVGGVCLVLAGHPMDTIKVRLQTMPTPKPGEKPKYKNTWDCVKQTFFYEGPRGFYRGMFAPLIAATPINAVCFFGFGLGVTLQTGSPKAADQLTLRELYNAGALSGALTATINAPVERIKCLLQIEQGSRKKAKYKGFWDCAKQVYSQGGIRSLYTGLLPTFLRDIPGSGCYFLGYEYFKRNGSSIFNIENESVITLMAGGIGGLCFWAVAIPWDVIKSRIQTAPDGKYLSLTQAIRYMYQRNGIKVFYKGITPIFIRAFPANAACFYGYECANQVLDKLF